jgi:hypothetical protein
MSTMKATYQTLFSGESQELAPELDSKFARNAFIRRFNVVARSLAKNLDKDLGVDYRARVSISRMLDGALHNRVVLVIP